MDWTTEEQKIIAASERRANREVRRSVGRTTLFYIGVAAMICAGVVGLLQRDNVPHSLLLIGFAITQTVAIKLQNQLNVSMCIISKLRAEPSTQTAQ